MCYEYLLVPLHELNWAEQNRAAWEVKEWLRDISNLFQSTDLPWHVKPAYFEFLFSDSKRANGGIWLVEHTSHASQLST